MLFLGIAVILLTDAVDVDTQPEATKLIVLAIVLALGSVAMMVGALVWTLAARARSERDGLSSKHPAPAAGYGPAGYGGGPAGYGGGPAQEAWIPSPAQHPGPAQPHS